MNHSSTAEYPKELRDLADGVFAAGGVLYTVGGCVRDELLQQPRHDLDVTGALPPQSLIPILEERAIPFAPVNERLGTLLLWPNTWRVEYTAFRTESYGTGGAHTPEAVVFTDDIRKDALRRDFSVNALYRNIRTGELVDPTGGLKDLAAKTLRTTTQDPAVILRDDGLRILRLARFSARLGFAVEEGTLACAKEQAGLLDGVAWERKRDELTRILTGERVQDALCLLRDMGALRYVLPELLPCDGVAQRADYHWYDVLTHSFQTCAQTPPDPVLRLAGLLHDVGKPAAQQESGTMHGHDLLGVPLCQNALRTLRVDNRTAAEVTFLVRWHMFDLDGRAAEATVRRRFCKWGVERTERLIALREADVRGSGMDAAYTADKWRRILAAMQREHVPFGGRGLAVTGADIMRATGLPAGVAVGRIKDALVLHCAVHPEDNTVETLQKLARTRQKDGKSAQKGAEVL